MDTYLSDKVDQIENNYPSITKPTEQVINLNILFIWYVFGYVIYLISKIANCQRHISS